MSNPASTSLLAVIALAATLTACSTNREPSAQPVRDSTSTTTHPSAGGASADAQLAVDGHRHQIFGQVSCTAQAANPSATPPLGNLAISASDDTASFAMSWLSSATSPLMALTLTYKVDRGEYNMPYYPKPPDVQATTQSNRFTVKGTPPVLRPGENTLKNLPVEIDVTCP
jgi:hypothetical protein